ncbi:MAG: 4Fe-4S dicluster domain-containing protein [Thermoplasmatota archaeon]
MAPRVLVLGGGPAGLQAAWGLVGAGVETVLAEKGPVLGGNLSHNKLLFPLREEAFRLLRERHAELSRSPRLTILLSTELAALKREGGGFEATLSVRPTHVDRLKCTLCGECVRVCPVEFGDPESLGLATRRAAHHYNGIPEAFVIQRERCAPGCRECERACPAGAVALDEGVREVKGRFQAVIIATGLVPYNMRLLHELGYGRSPDILTGLEFELLFRPGGPTGGRVLKPSDRTPPRTVAILTCVGSRDEKHRPYCCQVGCMNALNQALTVKEQLGGSVEVYVCFTDVRAHGKYYEEFYRRVRGAGVRFLRGKPSEVWVGGDGSLSFDIFDTATHKLLKLRADLIVLEPALVNAAPELAPVLGVELDREGFFSTDSDYSLPVKSSAPGIFVAGAASGPKDVVSAMAHASAAALAALRHLRGGSGGGA